MALKEQVLVDQDYKYGFRDETLNYAFKSRKGVDHDIVEQISQMKGEPQWMSDFRHRSLDIFFSKPMPAWADNELLGQIDFDDIYYYMRASDVEGRSWEDVPADIKRTFDRLGVPQAERAFLGGVTAQYDSEVVYHSIRKDLEAKGVLFSDMGVGLREHEDIVRQHFATVIPPADNKFSALNSAVWSGGSFIWVPPGVHVDIPLQAYFRINSESMGQFERTLIIAEPGSFVHYIEGCTAPTFSSNSLHSAVVELIAKEGAHIRYTTIQNWYKNVYNLVTKRALAEKNAHVEWVDGNIGSKLTMKYPSVYLMGEGARGDVLSIAYASEGQHQDAGSKMVHAAPNTTSLITSKSVSKGGGRTTYRGLVKVYEGCDGVKSNVRCDALLMDPESRSDTYPTMEVDAKNVRIEHEATVSKVGEEQLFYVMSRGLSEVEATTMIVNGFFEPFVKELPMEYAVELNRLIALEMEGSVG
ncbi:MAG: Fe-S cluster assembly protein SufB [Candidatus Eremiobacter antarcticus]|nr:Fe-S cluster assembly protein SufB [Candidatus Eremiobacteraeota bacterium]MBC5807859.1 Fe-S cluster assembly protein SufB [Candidatus Eremiobacteraeota bacterium]PZR62769.1 MAG: Fe-S cluster assembly protein SufB [Candidatus Eremiobacter sp. RRmetagenome_bin22]